MVQCWRNHCAKVRYIGAREQRGRRNIVYYVQLPNNGTFKGYLTGQGVELRRDHPLHLMSPSVMKINSKTGLYKTPINKLLCIWETTLRA